MFGVDVGGCACMCVVWVCVHVFVHGARKQSRKVNGQMKTTSQQANNVFDNVFNENVISSYCKIAYASLTNWLQCIAYPGMYLQLSLVVIMGISTYD